METTMSDDKHPLEYVSQITELNDLCKFLNDPAIDDAMEIMVKLFMNPRTVPLAKVPGLIVKLQAVSGMCAVKAKHYMYMEKDAHKKNVYFTLREALDKLVDALKYLAKYGNE